MSRYHYNCRVAIATSNVGLGIRRVESEITSLGLGIKISSHNIISWVYHTRRLGVTIDNKLTWSKNLTDFKKSFVSKLNLLKRSSFIGRRELLDLYFKIILPSITYAILIWVNCENLEHIKTLEDLHCRAGPGGLIYSLPWDTLSEEVMVITKWNSIDYIYRLHLVKVFYNIVNGHSPNSISDLVRPPIVCIV